MYDPPRPLIEVASLLGTRQVALAIECLGSLKAYSTEPVLFRLHDDGTLQGDDIERLSKALDQPTIVSRALADERINDMLAKYSSLRNQRRHNPYLLKLLDITLLSSDSVVAYCDTDILFLKPYRNLFAFPSERVGACFMQDVIPAYSLSTWQIARHRLRLPRMVNSGVILFRREYFDLDLLEWYFSHPEFHTMRTWVEQTAWALLGARVNCNLYDELQISIPRRDGQIPTERVALHFTKPVRDRIGEVRQSVFETNIEPIAIRSHPAAMLDPTEVLVQGVVRRARRLASQSLGRLFGS